MPYTVRWTEVSSHERKITEEEMATIKGITVAELRDLDEDEVSEGLDDDLASLDDDGFEGLERSVDEVTWNEAP